MKLKFIKSSLVIGCLLASMFASRADIIVGTPVNNTVNLLSTNRASVYSLNVAVPSAVAGVVQLNFYDTDRTNAPIWGTNYTNLAYIQRVTTNGTYVTNYVGQNGLTNWYTNIGVLTYTSTVASATSALTPMISVAVASGQSIIFDVDALFTRGITVQASSNATVILSYKPAGN